MVGGLAWTVGEQVQNGRGLGLDSWRKRSEWLGAMPGRLGQGLDGWGQGLDGSGLGLDG